MSLKKTRAFLEYYAKAAKGVPAGAQAEEALEELAKVERAARDVVWSVQLRVWKKYEAADVLERVAREAP